MTVRQRNMLNVIKTSMRHREMNCCNTYETERIMCSRLDSPSRRLGDNLRVTRGESEVVGEGAPSTPSSVLLRTVSYRF